MELTTFIYKIFHYMNNATTTQLMRGATPPTNQIQAATLFRKKEIIMPQTPN